MAAALVRNVETGGIVQEWRSAAWGFWPFGQGAASVSKPGGGAGKSEVFLRDPHAISARGAYAWHVTLGCAPQGAGRAGEPRRWIGCSGRRRRSFFYRFAHIPA
ncbi:hypothetical protein [Burkholderia thailandensis]|uniref:hypothetical protein n=1 Tax=Burkholderia thailandensis TaxID=57975 RepID=UPI0012DB5261|nr:hypothetical protein [Burkholderia thailandensis]MCS6463895.1 hypothetical protein [Burkholderia thailandensis]MDW9237687.1 hypothetical protein [Burkholderia thailandensis]